MATTILIDGEIADLLDKEVIKRRATFQPYKPTAEETGKALAMARSGKLGEANAYLKGLAKAHGASFRISRNSVANDLLRSSLAAPLAAKRGKA